MRVFYRLFLVFITIFSASLSFAQQHTAPTNGSIRGKLVDANNSPVSYASVALWRTDSSVVNGDLSKDDGSFSIAPTGTGNFILVIQSIGVTTKYLSVQIPASAPDKNMGTIPVVETKTELKAATIVGEKPLIQMSVDKKVFNVAQNTTSAGGSAADALQNVPSVSVDADGNVSLRGKSDVTILIDGKPATMLGPDVASALQSLPASSIEDVEVMTNPSAKYDASGSSGIINIITKKDNRFGINGTLTLGAGTHDKYNGNLSLNAHKGKWNYFLNSSVRYNTTWNTVTTDRFNLTQNPVTGKYDNFYTYENVPHTFQGNFNTIGATYEPNKYNSITLTENVNIMQFSFNDNALYNTYLTNGPVNQFPTNADSSYARNSSQAGGPVSTSTAIDYKHKFKKKDEELDIDGTFAYTTIWHAQNYITDDFYPTNSISSVTQNAPGNGNNNSVNVWADYTDPLFTPNGKLGLGFKSQLYYFNSNNNPTVDTIRSGTGTNVVDQSLLANYNYTQQIHAAYANWNDQEGNWGYQIGLRLEDNIYNGSGYVPTYATFQNHYLDLFPSAFLSYKLTDDQSIYLSYTRRTDRPGFRQLLPYIDLSNPGTVSQGNPGLVPEFINNVELSYSLADKHGNNVILSAYYTYTQNLIQTITVPLTASQAQDFDVSSSDLLSRPVNIASGTTYGAEATGHVQITKFWDATANANFFQNELVIGNTNQQYNLSNNQGFEWFGKINTNFKLPKSFSLQLNANYMSPQVITQGTLKQSWWMDAALRKSFWKNKATLIVNCSDIFKTRQFVTTYNLAAYNETIDRVKETRVGNVTFTYRFGKTDTNKNGKRSQNMSEPPVPSDDDHTKNLKQGEDNGNDQSGGGGNGGGNGGGQGGGKGSGASH